MFEYLTKLVQVSGKVDLFSQISKDIWLQQIHRQELRASLEERTKMYTSALEIMKQRSLTTLELDDKVNDPLNLFRNLSLGMQLSPRELQFSEEIAHIYMITYLNKATMIREQMHH